MNEQPAVQLDRARMLALLSELGERIARHNKIVEIAIFGGSALVLQFDFRLATQDVDYVPLSADNQLLKREAAQIAREHRIDERWINDAMRLNPKSSQKNRLNYFGDFPPQCPGLRVFVASAAYIFAMKVLAMRSSFVSKDVEDLWHLWDHLGIETAQQAIDVVQSYYPGKHLPARHIRILEDIEQSKKDGETYSPMLGW